MLNSRFSWIRVKINLDAFHSLVRYGTVPFVEKYEKFQEPDVEEQQPTDARREEWQHRQQQSKHR